MPTAHAELPPTPGGPGTTGTSIRDHAAAYVERGWHVFALGPGKTPLANCARCRAEHTTPEQMENCSCLTCHGFYAATCDMDRVDAMFMAHPDRLLAIRTGATSGIVVVDIDGPEGAANAQRLAAQGLLRPTLTAQTGSGGAHLVYTHPGGRIQSGAHKIAPSIDSKADGGYIVAPPSIHPRTRVRYRWTNWGQQNPAPLPDPIAELLRPPPPPPPRTDYRAPAGHNLHRRLTGVIDTVLDAQPGNRNATLYWASCVAAEMIHDGDLTPDQALDVLLPAAQHVGLTETEARNTINSGLRKAGGAR